MEQTKTLESNFLFYKNFKNKLDKSEQYFFTMAFAWKASHGLVATL